MKIDGEIKLLLEERRKGASQKLAAARTGMSERTVRKYEQSGKLPSQMKAPRTHRRWCPQKWCMRSDSRGAGSPIS